MNIISSRAFLSAASAASNGAIAETGYAGHVAQEFISAKPDALASLRQAVGICDV